MKYRMSSALWTVFLFVLCVFMGMLLTFMR